MTIIDYKDFYLIVTNYLLDAKMEDGKANYSGPGRERPCLRRCMDTGPLTFVCQSCGSA